MIEFLKKMLGAGNDAKLKKLEKTVEAVMALEEEYRALTDEQLQAKTEEFRQRLNNGETEDDILPEAFATVREAADRVLGMRPYRVQVLGGIALHQVVLTDHHIVPQVIKAQFIIGPVGNIARIGLPAFFRLQIVDNQADAQSQETMPN